MRMAYEPRDPSGGMPVNRRASEGGDADKVEAYHATLAALIHDLRGPVSRVKAVAELLRDEIGAAPANSAEANAALEWLNIVNRATETIDEVLGNMLTAARSAGDSAPSSPAEQGAARPSRPRKRTPRTQSPRGRSSPAKREDQHE
jgi:signal transduction histidine kinase